MNIYSFLILALISLVIVTILKISEFREQNNPEKENEKNDTKIETDTISETEKIETDTISETAKIETDTISETAKIETDTISETAKIETDTISETAKIETDTISETAKIETDKATTEQEHKEDQIHYFTGIYKSEKGKKIKAFNPLGILINDNQYSIYYLSNNTNSKLRQIEEGENLDSGQREEIELDNINNGYFDSPEDNFIEIKVVFIDPLTSLDFLFTGCDDLISVDLSHMNFPNINRLSYTFNDCKNIEKINLTSLDTSNVENMEFLFAGCDNLVEIIGLENLNTSSLRVATGIFLNCRNLQIVNISSFDLDNIAENYGLFVNTTSLQVVDLGNCSDANNIFNPNEELNIIIIANDSINTSLLLGNVGVYVNNETNNISEIIEELSCIRGFDDKCYECNEEKGKKNLCSSCNFGYYLPEGVQYSRTKCKICDEGCIDCVSENNSDTSFCYYCDWYYSWYNGKCIKYCELGQNEKCQECKSELEGKNDECLSCNDGYFLDTNYSKSVCRKGDVENCKEYNFESGNLQCIKCLNGYMLYDNKCYESCEVGYGKKCATCNPLFEYRKFCQTCNKNYYLYNGINSTECRSCSYGLNNHCQSCELIGGEIFCTECLNGYKLIDGKCFKDCDNGCISCFFDGKTDGKCLKCQEAFTMVPDYNYWYEFDSDTLDSDYSDYSDYINITNTTNITYSTTDKHYTCLGCPYGCKSCYDPDNGYNYWYSENLVCTSCINGYKLIGKKCEWQCSTYNGNKNRCLTCDNNILGRCATCNPNYYLNITSGKCISCGVDNCTICNEKKECLECDINYKLENNKCVKICEIGSEEKCKKCNNNIGNSEECLECNDGYYLPEDTNKKECAKCPEGCTDCYGNTNQITCTSCESCFILNEGKCVRLNDDVLYKLFCLKCNLEYVESCVECKDGSYLFPINKQLFQCKECGPNIKKCHETDGKIIIDECNDGYKLSGEICLKECEKGGLSKCLSCKTTPGEINQCAECNKGFYIPDDSIDKEKCIQCQDKGCIKCSGLLNNDICSECHKDYILYEGKCIKNCEKGYDNKCLKCSKEPGNNDKCGECNYKYYLPEYSTDLNKNFICKKCPNNCLSCYGEYDNPICTGCINDYIVRNGKCIEGCRFLLARDCIECDDSNEFPVCLRCYEGTFFPSDRSKKYDKCYKCSMIGCKKCQGETEYTDECIECKSEYAPIMSDDGRIQSCLKLCDIGTKNKCKSCSDEIGKCGQCNDGYELNGGMCYIKDFDVEAEYETTKENEWFTLMNKMCIESLEVDGEPYIENLSNKIFASKPGIHKIRMKLYEYCSFPSLFNNNPYLKSIIFFNNFNSYRITLMNDCFTNCPNLESVDLSNLDLGNNKCFMNFFRDNKKLKEVHFPKSDINPYYLYGMFQNCESLTSIDISSIHNDNAYPMNNMFNGCSNLKTLNISGFTKTNVDISNMLDGLPKNGNIIANPIFKLKIEYQIPEEWVVEINDPNLIKSIFVIGDSTASSNGANDGKTEGWGKYLEKYISAEIKNKAFLGESARTFYRDGRWNNTIKKIVKGDYVFIQFGHFDDGDVQTNLKCSIDGTGDETVTIEVNGVKEIVHTFPWYIKHFANQVLTKGANPVLISLTPSFSFVNGKISETNKYQEFMKLVSDKLKIPFIDLYSYIRVYYENYGENYLRKNNWFPIDDIHTSPEAAEFNAKMIINSLKCKKIEDLTALLNSEGNVINYPCSD